MPRGKSQRTYVPKGPTPSPENSPSRIPSSSRSSSGGEGSSGGGVSSSGGGGSSGGGACPTGGGGRWKRLGDVLDPLPDEELNLISAGILRISKKVKLSNRATNILGELDEAWVEDHNGQPDSDEMTQAPDFYLISQVPMLKMFEKTCAVEYMLSNSPIPPSPVNSAAAASTSSGAGPKEDPNTLTAAAKTNITSQTQQAFLSPSNPALASGGVALINKVINALRADPALLGAHGAHLLKKSNAGARSLVEKEIRQVATRFRSDFKELIRQSIEGVGNGDADVDDEDNDGHYGETVREFANKLSTKFAIDVSYDFLCRLAWLRKQAKQNIKLAEAGIRWWDMVQAELNVVVRLLHDASQEKREQGQRVLQKALDWDKKVFGECDDLRNEARPASEARHEEQFRAAEDDDVNDNDFEGEHD
ncbi:hypothetical protein OC842_000450 [Tilletia horrida]|uniref:Uncharacterized protein n=1 Tax=Tilletia horrida TaxID=155126 RepID=A0AAN6JU47_9BASI|nr:hypothetical protein OC842_000450 [Tilletia horrida]